MNVPHTESLTFYVQSFNSNDPSLTEFVVLENGHIATKNEGYRFSVDAPSPNGSSVDFTLNSNNTFRLYLNSYLRGKNSIKLYLSRNPFNGEYSGPITFVSSNGNRNTSYAAECEKGNYEAPDDQKVEEKKELPDNQKTKVQKELPDDQKAKVKKETTNDEKPLAISKKPQVAYIDTNLEWKFYSPKTVSIQESGLKTAVLNTGLLNARIVPTKGMKTLIDRLNPGLAVQEHISKGTTFNLPVFREPDKNQVKNMQLQIQKDTSKDETQNELIAVKTKNFSNMLKILRNLNAKGEYMDLLQKSEALLNKIVLNLPKIKFKRYHAVMISTEIEKLTNYLFRLAAQNTLPKTNSNYISSFNKYIENIINPYYYTKAGKSQVSILSPSSTSGIMSAKQKFIFSTVNGFYRSDQEYAFVIHVFIPVPQKTGGSFDYKDSMRHYWVYVLDPFEYDNLNDVLIEMDPIKKNGLPAASLNKIITKADLDGTGAKCDAPASITSKSIDFGRAYHFIVVSDISNEIVIHDYIENTSDIQKHSSDKNIPELYGIGLYQEFKGK